ncbi:unnamed protein product [Miscanthus lutarioriparius]|uniref:Btz domain-containing protein n=1 Tax=Miscanthus lutarioriparius TaxID=422564 RepID=A0A811P737_9POAL|nr:unnamed protein product [Miscanthus lutarioriparius]
MAAAEKVCEEGTEEYESDLDDGPLSAARRRGAASDDDEEEEGGGGSRRGSPPPSTMLGSGSDDSGGQGAAELYDDEEVYGGTEEEDEDVEYEDVREEYEAGVGGGETGVVNGEVSLAADEGKYEDNEAAAEEDEEEEAAMRREEVKKASDSEPYAVPTAGVFYQHDIRFQGQEDGNRGYQRQIFGGQKIWDPKEEAVWAHDLFNEINFHDNKHDNASIMHSVDNDYFHGCKSYYDTKIVENVKQTQFHSYDGNAKGYSDERNKYRERGSRTNQSRRTTSRISSAQNNTKSYSKSQDAEILYNAVYQQKSVQRPILPTPRVSAKIFVQKVMSTNKIQSHPQTTLVSSSGDGEATAPPKSNSSVVVSAVTGHDDMSEAERTYFLDGGSLVLGNTGARGSILDDPGSSNTTAKLPVMLFSGLHPRGPGFTSDAMVLPEFVDQRRGGNFEMRLMACESRSPILTVTGATGVQEGAISPPYFGSNCLQHFELTSPLASPSDHGVKKDPISLTSQDPMSLTYQKIPEVKGHEFINLQNRTRRYSEMSFAL